MITARVLMFDDRTAGEGVLGIDLVRRLDIQDGRARVTLAHSDATALRWGEDCLGRVVRQVCELVESCALQPCACERVLRRMRR